MTEQPGLSGALRDYGHRLSQGELANLPVLLGLILIWAVFTAANDRFPSAVNLTNLMLQIPATGTIAIGVVIVLLIGEIDLSIAQVSGLSAAIMAVTGTAQGVPGPFAILIALAAGAVIGLFHGLWITRFRVPSFVVTLAGLLGWLGGTAVRTRPHRDRQPHRPHDHRAGRDVFFAGRRLARRGRGDRGSRCGKRPRPAAACHCRAAVARCVHPRRAACRYERRRSRHDGGV